MSGVGILSLAGLISATLLANGYTQYAGAVMVFANSYALIICITDWLRKYANAKLSG
jgi:hypothetical protein